MIDGDACSWERLTSLGNVSVRGPADAKPKAKHEFQITLLIMADQPQQQVYPFDIPSIFNLHPGIPANVVHTLHLDENIAIGDPIDILNTKQAQGVATSLAHLQGECIIHQPLAYVLIQFKTSVRAGHYR